ncbi:MAG: asparaginase [Rhizobiales bacterium]|nr:asparaginase [Hyphomicrobiales bacterium]MDQ3557763.1 asparaginase [Pseudomonadota bacterium]
MSNPVLVEVTRGDVVESRHRGAVSVQEADGNARCALGDVDHPVFPRSAVKALQALPLVETGAADAFGYGARELALAQASHGGEPAHVEGVAAMLAAIGLSEADLECGPQLPSHKGSAALLMRDGGTPSQLHNNCSGKHANFLSVASHLGVDQRGYVLPRHPVQDAIRDVLESLTGASHNAGHRGTDGCSIPTYAAPLSAFARGFARFATGAGLSPLRAGAAKRILDAAVSAPFFVAGSGRFDTEVMEILNGAALVKGGAEGVHCAALPALGLGVAVKCDDGDGRASSAIMAALLARLMPEHEEALRRWTARPVLTRRGAQAGEVRAVKEAFAGLS